MPHLLFIENDSFTMEHPRQYKDQHSCIHQIGYDRNQHMREIHLERKDRRHALNTVIKRNKVKQGRLLCIAKHARHTNDHDDDHQGHDKRLSFFDALCKCADDRYHRDQ